MDRRKTDAIHEAGHAVACYRFWPDRLVGDLTIVHDMENNAAGSHETLEALEFPMTDDAEELARQDAEFERGALYSCAGYGALVAAGYSAEIAEHGAWSDFERAENCTSTPLAVMKQRAVEFMRRPENVAAVRRLADELLEQRETIPGDEIAWLIDIADGTTSEHVYRLYVASKHAANVRD